MGEDLVRRRTVPSAYPARPSTESAWPAATVMGSAKRRVSEAFPHSADAHSEEGVRDVGVGADVIEDLPLAQAAVAADDHLSDRTHLLMEVLAEERARPA